MFRTALALLAMVASPFALAQLQPPSEQQLPGTPALERPAATAALPPVIAPATAPSAPASAWTESLWWLALPTWLLALAAIGLAVYTARLWAATSGLLRQTQESARRELRAYIALDEIFFDDADNGEGGRQRLRVRNYGQTPAYRLSIWCERASHLPQEGVKPFYDSPAVDGQLLHPVQAHTVTLPSAPPYRTGKAGFFTYGRLVYCDTYGQWWVTKFCYRYEGDSQFVPHGDYNHEEGPFDAQPA